MSYLDTDVDILKGICSKYMSIDCVGSAQYRTYLGTMFVANGTYSVSSSTPFRALLVNPGFNGSNGTIGTNYSGGRGGDGGNVSIITGTLTAGNYSVVVSTTSGGVSTFNSPVSYTISYSSIGGAGGAGGTYRAYVGPPGGGNATLTSPTSGANGPVTAIAIEPFIGFSCSGGGGGGRGSDGRPAVGGIGGVGMLEDGGDALSTSYGSGGGGGGGSTSSSTDVTGGRGGPGFVWIVPTLPNASSISSRYFSGTSNLDGVLGNMFRFNNYPNEGFNIISAGGSIITPITDRLLINDISIGNLFNTFGFSGLPFNITSSTPGASYYANYVDGYFTLAFRTSGATYTMTTSKTLSFDVIVVGTGGTGGTAETTGRFANGGGGGGKIRASKASLPAGTITIRTNSPATYPVTNFDWGVDFGNSTIIAARNGSNGLSSQSSRPSSSASSGASSSTGMVVVTMTNVFGSYRLFPQPTFPFTDGFGLSISLGVTVTNFGGNGSVGVSFGSQGSGGQFSRDAGAPSNLPQGFGSGGGVASTNRTTPGENGIVLMSFAD